MIDDRRLMGIDLGIASDHTGAGARRSRRRGLPSPGPPDGGELGRGGDGGVGRGGAGDPVGGGDRADRAGLVADRGVLHRPRAPGVPRVQREGGRPAPVPVAARQVQRHEPDALARLPLLAPASLHPLELATTAETAALDRRVRACDRLTQQGALHQRRIKDLVRQLMPTTPLTGELTKTDLAVLGRWPDPRALLGAGRARLLTVITTVSHGHQGARPGRAMARRCRRPRSSSTASTRRWPGLTWPPR